jgi:DNA-directed RNA polymerase sigma subunit (sigma70/sigma32)
LKLRSAATVQQRVQNAALAKTLLTQYNVRLVVSVARQYSDRCGIAQVPSTATSQ